MKSERILVTGSNGLLGSAIIDLLRGEGYQNIIPATRDDCDLTDANATLSFFESKKPTSVLHTAARVYGIMGNIKNKALSFYDNILINTNVIDSARRTAAKKIVVIGTGAVYPYPAPSLPYKEDMI